MTQLRADGVVVNCKRVAQLMRFHGLQVRTRWRYAATTDSDNNNPTSPNLTKDIAPNGPHQFWVADTTFTYIATSTGFVYIAVIVDAWSRRMVGYALGHAIEAQLTVAALEVARSRGSLRIVERTLFSNQRSGPRLQHFQAPAQSQSTGTQRIAIKEG